MDGETTKLKEIIISTVGKTEQLTTLLDREHTENHVKKKLKYLNEQELKYPKSILFIICNEFCERFSFYGMRALLSLYLHKILEYDPDRATVIYHCFLSSAYFFPLVGAAIADSFLGKFRTIFYISIVYAIGNATISLSSTDLFSSLQHQRLAALLGLFLIAFGTGGIKPCVSSFGGDQFILPQQGKQLELFFSIFYFSINAGSLISTYVTPVLKYDIHCLGKDSCYPLAFGVPSLLMLIAIIIFVCGRPFYVVKKPEGNVLLQVFKCISYALCNKFRGKGEKKPHWLNYAEDKFDKQLIEEIKSVFRVLILFIPIPAFWALFDQQGSRWTFQASNMDGSLGWLGTIQPEQMQIINPFLILLFIPLFQTFVYPFLARFCKIKRPLQKISVGGLLTASAFIISGILELYVQKSYPVLPGEGLGQMRIYNGLDCSVDLYSDLDEIKGTISPYDMLQITNFPVKEDSFDIPFTINTTCPAGQLLTFNEKVHINKSNNMALSYMIAGVNVTANNSMIIGKHSPNFDDVSKSKKGLIKIGVVYNVKHDTNITLALGKQEETIDLEKIGYSISPKTLNSGPGKYKLSVGKKDYDDILLEYGGLYSLFVVEKNDGFEVNLYTIQPPNSVSLLWQIPQYVVITASEIMVSITGLELSYSQAPVSMKSVLAACWLLTTSMGNIIVVIISEISFGSQAVQFFTFAGMMVFVMCIFMLIAKQYRYVNTSEEAS